jgi:hypothetical protein
MTRRKIIYLIVAVLALICALSIPIFNLKPALTTTSGGMTNVAVSSLRSKTNRPPRVIKIEGTVEVMRGRPNVWAAAYTNQVLRPGDRLRTGQGSRATIMLKDASILRLGQLCTIQVPGKRSAFDVLRDMLDFFLPQQTSTNLNIQIQTPTVSAEIKG